MLQFSLLKVSSQLSNKLMIKINILSKIETLD